MSSKISTLPGIPQISRYLPEHNDESVEISHEAVILALQIFKTPLSRHLVVTGFVNYLDPVSSA